MSPRTRVSLVVAAAAIAAAGVTVAATSLMSTDLPDQPGLAPRDGVPPLVLDLGVRTDPQARALRRAVGLHRRGRLQEARRIFARYGSVEAEVGEALSDWPQGVERLRELARDRPRSGAAQLALGLAAFWEGDLEAARAAWARAKAAEPDTQYAIRAADLLHPELPVPGLPTFVPSFPSPGALGRLSPPRQLAFLRRRARGGDAQDHLLYGAALQRLGRPLSARREFATAHALVPEDPDALTASAVGLFDKDRPADAFSRLGPLARRFPKAATVRFHLGLLLVWMGRVEDARRQFRLAREVEPGSIPARQAAAFLRRLPAA
ncbi:MAG TPA: tetratricopeptide repeat protein [Gaiellaceae bacterium]|nr:tetratricopeptide repeat protein [Gaiellaceae bacterium]